MVCRIKEKFFLHSFFYFPVVDQGILFTTIIFEILIIKYYISIWYLLQHEVICLGTSKRLQIHFTY